uniref:Uncharacterized protein n=1 Tax=Trichogramma kaykai TaxID=54128 RepID=A0ABD2VTN6_9HYME
MSKKTDTSFIVYKILTPEHVKEATHLQIESSFQECLTIGFGIADIPGGTDAEGFEALLRSIVLDGFSIGAFDSKSGQLVGVCFNKMHNKVERDNPAPLEESVEENMKHPATLDLMNRGECRPLRAVQRVAGAGDILHRRGLALSALRHRAESDSREPRAGAQNSPRAARHRAGHRLRRVHLQLQPGLGREIRVRVAVGHTLRSVQVLRRQAHERSHRPGPSDRPPGRSSPLIMMIMSDIGCIRTGRRARRTSGFNEIFSAARWRLEHSCRGVGRCFNAQQAQRCNS